MTRKKVLSMVFAFMLVLNLFVDVRLNSALAAVKPGDVVSPQYTYTKKVFAQLWSDKPGVATCSGKVTVYDSPDPLWESLLGGACLPTSWNLQTTFPVLPCALRNAFHNHFG